MTNPFQKATKERARLRLALIGPSGSGKTYTSLQVGTALKNGGRVALVDTERGSASKYADLFDFDVLELETFEPQNYIRAIEAASGAGYDVLILDSLSHAWAGVGGILSFVDTETMKSKSRNAYTEGWRKATPLHNRLVDAMIQADLHLIVTMRAKTEYVMETDQRGKTAPRKVGMAPVQRDGLEYEFDVVGDMDLDNNLVVSKTRCPALTGKMFAKPGDDLAGILNGWLMDGTEPAPRKAPEPTPAPEPAPMNGDDKPASTNGDDKPASTGRPASIKTQNWAEYGKALAATITYYQNENGTPDWGHMTGAAGHLGYKAITDENLEQVLDALRTYAHKQQEEAGQQELPLAPM